MGASGNLVLCQFAPSAALLPNTEYTAVLIGDDSVGLFYGGDRRFEGLTSWTSPSGFTQTSSGINTGVTSGFIQVAHPYSKTIQTNQYDAATGYNDTYTITITSGHNTVARQGMAVSGFKYEWSQASSPGTFSATVSGTEDRHNLGNGLQIDFNGTFASGEVHQLDVYIPQPMATSQVWKFSTGAISQFGTPPVEPGNIAVVIDETADGGFGVDTVAQVSGAQFYVVGSTPAHLAYDITTSLAYIQLEFNKNIATDNLNVGNVAVTSTPTLGIPTPEAASTITPTHLEVSGRYLKIYLP
jgi:hypothetical protein